MYVNYDTEWNPRRLLYDIGEGLLGNCLVASRT